MKKLILLPLLALIFSFTCYSKNYEESRTTNLLNLISTPDIISENESCSWLRILEENKCFMKTKRETHIKILGNIFKKVKNLYNLKHSKIDKKDSKNLLVGEM